MIKEGVEYIQWEVNLDIDEFSFNGFSYKALKHDFFRHANERESRLRHLRPDPDGIFLDIGAACGTWTLPGSFLHKKVYAFEAFPGLAETLGENVRLNGIENVEVVNSIVQEKPEAHGKLECMATLWDGRFAMYDMSSKCYSIDSFVAEKGLGRVGFIKIDVEGAELGVLKGAKAVLERDHPRVLVEVHCMYGVTLDSVVDYMSWISSHYSPSLMLQADPKRIQTPCTVFGQHPPGHYHAFFEVKQPVLPEFLEEFGPV